MVELHGDAVLLRGLLDDAQPLRHDFLADPVAGDDRDPVWFLSVAHREVFLASIWPGLCTAIGRRCNEPNPDPTQRCSAMLTAACPAP